MHNECAWAGIKQILVNSNKIELFDKFHDAVHALNIGSSERKLLFTSIANLGDNASKFILDFIDSPSKLSKFAKEAGLVEAWGELSSAGVKNLANKLDDIKFAGKHLAEIKKAGGYKAWREVAIRAENIGDFASLTLAQKLENIKYIWNTKYPIPDMLGGRSYFEDIMGEYRYTKSSGWLHAGDISPNFKGIDFYKGTEMANQIFASTAVSMKTTIVTDVNKWLSSEPIKKNIEFLEQGWKNTNGLESNGMNMFFSNAEIHIYMPKANITDAIRTTWMNKLNSVNSKIKFEIKSLEGFIH